MPSITKMDWLGLERQIRQQLNVVKGYLEEGSKADAGDLALTLLEISDIIGRETGRGYVFNEAESRQFCERFGVKWNLGLETPKEA